MCRPLLFDMFCIFCPFLTCVPSVIIKEICNQLLKIGKLQKILKDAYIFCIVGFTLNVSLAFLVFWF